jgi:hypothetical protein
MRPLTRSIALLAGVLLAATGCASGSGDGTTAVAAHHDTTLPAGEGLHRSYVGYSIESLRLPDQAGTPGRYSFHIDDFRHRAQTKFVVDLTKRMHVYLIRDDLAVFRHLHPTMAADGTWSGRVTVPTPGRYRLITEFMVAGQGGNTATLLLGESRTIGHPVPAAPFGPVTGRGTEDGLTVTALSPGRIGSSEEMRIGLTFHGKPAQLGTFLGVYGHVTAVARHSGAIVHIHPLGGPTTRGNTTVLTLHTIFRRPDAYRLFVQVRLSGMVRTVPLNIRVSAR